MGVVSSPSYDKMLIYIWEINWLKWKHWYQQKWILVSACWCGSPLPSLYCPIVVLMINFPLRTPGVTWGGTGGLCSLSRTHECIIFSICNFTWRKIFIEFLHLITIFDARKTSKYIYSCRNQKKRHPSTLVIVLLILGLKRIQREVVFSSWLEIEADGIKYT